MAVTAGVLALAGGTLTAASPASAASASGSSIINVTNDGFTILLPDSRGGRFAAAENVTAFHGFSGFKNIVIQSQGFDLEGTIRGTITTHDYKALYNVYNLPYSAGFSIWGARFKADASRSVLKKTFEESNTISVAIDIKFKVSAANLRGVSTLRIGFETLRLQVDGTTKDFTVVNGDSGGAKDQNNNDIPVDFEEF
ncbi:hypothetical protein Aph02nite_52510 [Actinoplanes philippinensis]|uniref:Uncharacterized protein n=1 Tax=Actinoplanes philippinensis TaxID=35752 RepID=A0A1I2IMI6_9ACTN|nr:hypothetical protein [Actinoplanes philippinensis]GIE79301.1 hypothetical protein Aph02nite_52510 [Actinoplanes philippinensis]SFF42247.1 hypothetical protein SAMN05421541_110107 [Actinoplanes philippinensis]